MHFDARPRVGLTMPLLAVLAGAAFALPAHAEFPNMGDVMLANGFDRPTSYTGGSNYLWHDLGPECDRAPYGLLPNYNKPGVRVQAQQQLATMYARGMRSLSTGIFFRSGISTGDVIDASVPAQVSQAVQNLSILLDDIQAAGFERVLFRFFPQHNMNPSLPSFDPNKMALYWQLVQAMHLPLEHTSLPYKIDLGVELAPADKDSRFCAVPPKQYKWECPADKNWSNAVRNLWREYKQTYGTADSVGFSFLTATNRAKRRLRHMKYVYEGDYPSELAMDFYGEPLQGTQVHDASDQFINMALWTRHYSDSYGFPMPGIIISETWYNDPLVAASLSSAIFATGQRVPWLSQWPLEHGASCDHVSVPPPYQYDMYRVYGF